MKDEENSLNGMGETLPGMPGLSAFEAAGRHLSFADAARQLGRTPSAVSHAVRDLEHQLGETLFERAGRTVKLTEAGEEYLLAVQEALSVLRMATRRLKRRGEAHVVRVSALPFFTSAVLLPNLNRFEQDNPGYDLRIETSSAYADVLNGDVDIAIRFGSERSEALFCQPLVAVAGQPIASPGYLAANPAIKRARDLNAHTLLHVQPDGDAWQAWGRAQGIESLTGKSTLTFDSILGALDAARAGLGIALAMAPLIETYPGYGQGFGPVLKPVGLEGVGYNFVCRRTSVDDQKIRRTLEWLQDCLGAPM